LPEILQIASLWKKAKARNEAVYLATVVQVSGSSYRKPGARMLVTSGGERAGSISGGCLEAEVTRRISWLTSSGAVVQRYNSFFDDESEGTQYGLGCGGTIWVLMEPEPQAIAVLEAMERAAAGDGSSVVVSGLTAGRCGTFVIADGPFLERHRSPNHESVAFNEHFELAERALLQERFLTGALEDSQELPGFVYIPIFPPPRLTVFGAGQDAQPLVSIAAELGWHVEVADGRPTLLRRERFPKVSSFRLLVYDAEGVEKHGRLKLFANEFSFQTGDLAVLLTHSYELDRALLEILLPQSLSYLGVLGPLHRTQRLLSEVAPDVGLTSEECLSKVHAPAGLDLGVGDASTIALSILSEMQACLAMTVGSVERKRG
jgi:xanthine dehydrogenase accessory factor